jgi:hypothetical protein
VRVTGPGAAGGESGVRAGEGQPAVEAGLETLGAPAAVELPVRLARQHRGQAASAALQDGPVAAALVAAAVATLRAPRGAADLALAVVEVVVGGWVLALVARGVAEAFGRRHRAAPAAPIAAAPIARVRWEGVAAGALALVEVWHHWHTTGRIRRPTVLVGVFALCMALGGAAAIERRASWRRRGLVVSGAGIRYRGSILPRDRFEARWDEVARVEAAPDALRVVLRDGGAWTLRARAHLDGEALVLAAAQAVRAHAGGRLVDVASATGVGRGGADR